MKVFKGETAKDFNVKDIYGNEIRLSNYKGKKILLGFFRNVNCPFCNMRVHQLLQKKKKYDEKGLQMILIFESASRLLLRSTFHQGVSPMPLIGDPEMEIFGDYGVEISMMKMMKTFLKPNTFKAMKAAKILDLPKEKDKDARMALIPADFLIGEEFTIKKAHYGKHVNDHISFQDIEAFIK